MKSIRLKVAPIGNSCGVQIPAGRAQAKLSWEETAREMAAAAEDWNDWDATLADGWSEIPWESDRTRRVAD